MGNEGATDVGFQQTVVGSDNAAALTAATTQGASLAQIGAVFNAAMNVAEGGLNTANMGEFAQDMHAVATGVQNILNSPTQLAAIEAGETANAAALTTIHLQTVENQINLQLNKFDGQYATDSATAARATSDNLLDIIDIVQNDANLNTNAGGNGTAAATGGFAELAGFLTGTVTHYQDTQAQTNFWAQFLSEANVINNQLNAVANGTSTASVASLITEIQNYQQFGASFDNSQGGTFGARFDNELLGGTLEADSAAAVKGLTGIMNGDTGAALAADHAAIVAAGQGFAADANDVSGNNNPLGGGHYVGTATTVAGATSVAGLAQGTIPVGPVADGNTGLSSGGTTTAGTGTTGTGTGTTGTGTTGTGTTGTGTTGTGTGTTGTGAGTGTTTAGNHIVTDFTAFLHGTGSAQTFLADVTQLLGGGQNGIATLIQDLQQAAQASGAAAGGAGAAAGAADAAGGAGGAAGDMSGHSAHFEHIWHHG
jgi:trimeric autotransporter adhesin